MEMEIKTNREKEKRKHPNIIAFYPGYLILRTG
jgi:hypothetical protein